MTKELITSFYEAFSRRDAEGMVDCYGDDVRFSDPVFPDLRGERAKNMWRMLCQRGKDLEVTFRDVVVVGNTGSAHWEATYSFGPAKRRVHNAIEATFVLAGGKISEHIDRFDLWKWTGMALGLPGTLLGWSPIIQNAVRKKAARGLDDWMAEKAI